MKRIWITMVAAGLLAIAAIAPAAAQDDSLTIDLDEVDGSGISGTATLTEVDGQTEVSVELEGTAEDGVHPIHIHGGTCDDLGDVVYPLDDVVDGSSESTVDASLADILAEDHAINAHLSEEEMDVYIACGEVADDTTANGEDDAAVDEEDDAVAEDEDDAAVDEDEDAVTDEADDAAVDEDPAEEDDPAADDTEDTEDPAVTDDEEADDAEDIVPATGSIGGFGSEAGILVLTLGAGATLGAGLLIRRRSLQF